MFISPKMSQVDYTDLYLFSFLLEKCFHIQLQRGEMSVHFTEIQMYTGRARLGTSQILKPIAV